MMFSEALVEPATLLDSQLQIWYSLEEEMEKSRWLSPRPSGRGILELTEKKEER
jgi:hypothetical protein